ncbi:MAG: LysM peptidoglycan-binding domain-containing protein [Phycisphaerales bacterium]
MTREQKLGLIIGFTVVLVFGVLIADHLSRARTEPLIASDSDLVEEPLVIPAIAELEPLSSGLVPPPMLTEPTAVREPVVTASNHPSLEPADGVWPSFGPPSSGSESSPLDLASIFEPARPVARSETPTLPGFVPVVDRSPQARGEPEPVVVSEPTTADRATTHRVRRGETLFAIAERHYGNGHLWRELAKHNPSTVDASGRVSFDVVLTIPPRHLLTGERVPSGGSSGVVSSQVGYYTVREGDTLSEISQKLLGTVRRMDELIKMNSDQINDADDIRVGMKLRYERGPQA